MAEILISLVRNAACVAKSLLPPEHAVMQPLMSFPYVPFLPLGEGETAGTSGGAGGKVQLEMFTGLEGFIGLLQLVGACFNLWKGIKVSDHRQLLHFLDLPYPCPLKFFSFVMLYIR